MVRKIISVKDPRLRSRSKPVKKVDKKIISLVKDLKETLSVQKEPEGVGLAAIQIGKNLQIFVAKIDKDIRTFINPEIISKEKASKGKEVDKNSIMEGCLSVPDYYGPLKRAQKIKLKYKNNLGKEVLEEFDGFPAQIIQHEIDHLNGILFIDRLLEQKKPLYKLSGEEWEEVEL